MFVFVFPSLRLVDSTSEQVFGAYDGREHGATESCVNSKVDHSFMLGFWLGNVWILLFLLYLHLHLFCFVLFSLGDLIVELVE